MKMKNIKIIYNILCHVNSNYIYLKYIDHIKHMKKIYTIDYTMKSFFWKELYSALILLIYI